MNNLSEFIDENVRGLKPPYSYSEVEEILEKYRNAVLEKNVKKLEEYFGYVLNDGTGKPIRIELDQLSYEVIKLLKHE